MWGQQEFRENIQQETQHVILRSSLLFLELVASVEYSLELKEQTKIKANSMSHKLLLTILIENAAANSSLYFFKTSTKSITQLLLRTYDHCRCRIYLD